MNRAAMVFMISLVPAKIRVTRVSCQARAIGCSSQYLQPPKSCNQRSATREAVSVVQFHFPQKNLWPAEALRAGTAL